MIAALFVQTGGAYFGIPGVDPWDVHRDAFLYRGPHPVVAHPPCARWGTYAGAFPDGDASFDFCLHAVRQYGGVLEHPWRSQAWKRFGLRKPDKDGGWCKADGGWTCAVWQGNYGHMAPKKSWLYVTGDRPPELHWSRCWSYGHRATMRRLETLSRKQRAATPLPFRDLLLSLALPL